MKAVPTSQMISTARTTAALRRPHHRHASVRSMVTGRPTTGPATSTRSSSSATVSFGDSTSTSASRRPQCASGSSSRTTWTRTDGRPRRIGGGRAHRRGPEPARLLPRPPLGTARARRGESLVYWLRKLVFRGAYLTTASRRACSRSCGTRSGEFAYAEPAGGGDVELAPTPSWRALQFGVTSSRWGCVVNPSACPCPARRSGARGSRPERDDDHLRLTVASCGAKLTKPNPGSAESVFRR